MQHGPAAAGLALAFQTCCNVPERLRTRMQAAVHHHDHSVAVLSLSVFTIDAL